MKEIKSGSSWCVGCGRVVVADVDDAVVAASVATARAAEGASVACAIYSLPLLFGNGGWLRGDRNYSYR